MTSIPLPHRVGPRLPIPEVPIHSLFVSMINATISQDPERIAIIHYDNLAFPTVTYKQLLEYATKFANFVQTKNLYKKGEIVSISIPNCWMYAVSTISIPATGGVLSGFSHRNSPSEALYQLTNSEAVLLITTSDRLENILHLIEKMPHLRTIILIDKPSLKIKHGLKLPLFVWDDIMSETEPKFDFDSVEIDPREDLYVLLYSSGTTGLPKGVMITHYNYVAMLLAMKTHTENHHMVAIQNYVDTNAHDHSLLLVPLYHAMGFFILNANLCRGQTIVIIQKYGNEVMLEAIQKFKPTGVTVVPAVLQRFLQSPLIKKYDISSVVSMATGGSHQSRELANQFQTRFNSVKFMSQGYGMTELTTLCHSSSVKAVAGSIGIVLPNNEYRIVEPESGRECGVNEVGELWIRGPTIMKGYWRNEKATSEIITKEGWLKTGDLVREDADHQLFVVSRLKELIKVNAFQVAPTELEEIIIKLDGVADCAVIGIPNKESGELPRAFIVKRKGADISAQTIIDHVKERTSHYKWLKGGVQFVDLIPRSEAGKILRRQILKEYLESEKKAKL